MIGPSKNGITLLLVVFILSALLSISLGIFNITFGELRISGEIEDSFRALLAADQSIEKSLFLDRNGTGLPGCPKIGQPPPAFNPCYTATNAPVLQSNACYTLSVSKFDLSGDNKVDLTTMTTSGQYRCGTGEIRIVKRGLRVDYGLGTLPTGLLAGWKFDEGTDFIANDISGNGNTGTLTGGATWTTGVYGGAVSFDGINGYVNIPYNFGRPTTLTIAFWFRTSAIPSQPMPIFGQATVQPLTSPTSWVPTIQINPSRVLRAEYWTGGFGAIATTFAVNDGEWHHAALVGSGSNQELFVDGSSRGIRSGAINHSWWNYSTIGTGFTDVWREASSNEWRYFNGQIDDVRIYNKALTPAEITSAMNTPLP